ncbi:hypothetical protein BC835DRAFT_1370752 [Cytidiella melzeri]|nr:hypothetical protein BC835DRAFT_1370752 [Cytidiella melzeri]
MRLSIPFVLSAVVCGMFHMVTVSAIPHANQGSTEPPSHGNHDLGPPITDKPVVLPPVLTTRTMGGDYTDPADSNMDNYRVQHQALRRASPEELQSSRDPNSVDIHNLKTAMDYHKYFWGTLDKLQDAVLKELELRNPSYKPPPPPAGWNRQQLLSHGALSDKITYIHRLIDSIYVQLHWHPSTPTLRLSKYEQSQAPGERELGIVWDDMKDVLDRALHATEASKAKRQAASPSAG